jgi:hypothetical protein
MQLPCTINGKFQKAVNIKMIIHILNIRNLLLSPSYSSLSSFWSSLEVNYFESKMIAVQLYNISCDTDSNSTFRFQSNPLTKHSFPKSTFSLKRSLRGKKYNKK